MKAFKKNYSFFIIFVNVLNIKIISSNLSQHLCNLVELIIEECPETENLLIAKFDSNFSNDFIEKTLKCSPENIPRIVTDLIANHNHYTYGWKLISKTSTAQAIDVVVPKNSINILIADKIDGVSTVNL